MVYCMIFYYPTFRKPFSGENRALPGGIYPLTGGKISFGW